MTTEKVKTEVTNAVTTIVEPGQAKGAPEGDQIETTKDERANIDPVPVPLEGKSAVAEVSSGWEAAPYGSIIGFLLVVLTASTIVIYRRRQKAPASKAQALQPGTNPLEARAQPVTGHALSPDAALARIEEIRPSLLYPSPSPSLAPSLFSEGPTSPTEAAFDGAEPRPLEKLLQPV